MAVTERTVRNKRNSAGELTGKAGTVYDVNVKYKSGGKSKKHAVVLGYTRSFDHV